jgi:hypothetical protein
MTRSSRRFHYSLVVRGLACYCEVSAAAGGHYKREAEMPSYTNEEQVQERAGLVQARIKRSRQQEYEAVVAATRETVTEAYDKTTGAWVNPALITGAGVVTPPGQIRYKRAYASMRMGRETWANASIADAHKPAETVRQCPTYGWAVSPFGDADTAMLAEAARLGTSTVLVSHADGSLTIESQARYRKLRQERKAQQVGETDAQQKAAEAQARRDAQLDALTDVDSVQALADGTA